MIRLGAANRPVLSGDGRTIAWWANSNGDVMAVKGDEPHIVCPVAVSRLI